MSRMMRRGRGLNPLKDAIHHVKMGKDKNIISERYINPAKGRGVFANTLIVKGSFILEYRGTLIEKGDFEDILNEYAYFFNHLGHNYCIDASYDNGSLGRLVNDDEKPNAKMRKILDVDGKPHLCLFAIKDIDAGEEILYDYGGHNLPWRSRHGQEHYKHLHEPVAPTMTACDIRSPTEHLHEPVGPAMTACDIRSPTEHLHEPVGPAMTACDIRSPTEDITVGSQQESTRPGSGDDERGRKRKRKEKNIGVRRRETARVCKAHQLVKEEMISLEKCSVCSGPVSPLKWWGLKCKGLLESRPCPNTSEGLKADRQISENDVSSRGRRMPKRRPWTKPEVNAVMRHFKMHISKAHLATMRECEVCKRCEHPVLQNRSVQIYVILYGTEGEILNTWKIKSKF
ncbi:uncharacterized protein LOC130420671 isoform X4 [Triplophysa dalaica]|uniref:uncharacterized protein LOC130411534 isoform X4 n=1 Tax=Triplophysa dalaica TaxID=1582913 RepID=UPI0024DF703C|nr:uncharacterized protein LOC130411534 isoform X4 [Triplophysa dalaica]XP_056596609.1 uncharacterized protein LOC130414618 isoform X4 [Triplophysa dalaica]XP_056604131.1 uncharacterized protein LOC130420671 isoform X4 [Triplophysa dalaica]